MITYGLGTYAGVMTVITGDVADVPGLVRNELTTELGRIDVAVSSRLQSGSTVAANITKVNGILIDGVGTEANPWGPV